MLLLGGAIALSLLAGAGGGAGEVRNRADVFPRGTGIHATVMRRVPVRHHAHHQVAGCWLLVTRRSPLATTTENPADFSDFHSTA